MFTVACGRAAVNRDRIAGSRPPRPGLVLIPTIRVARWLIFACSAASQAQHADLLAQRGL
jgi:hypothetical protein